MTPQAQSILQSARVAELRTQADTVAAATRRAPPIELSRDSGQADRRRLLLLLARERRRNAALLELLR
jgi:hypothetical protein